MQNFDGSHKNFRLPRIGAALAKFMEISQTQAIISLKLWTSIS